MKFFVFLTLILSICTFSFAAESSGFFRDPDHPGKCVVENQILSPGEEAKMTEGCGRIMCQGDSYAVLQTCGVMSVGPPCRYGDYVNIDAPYPECCEKKIVCD